MAGVRAYNTPIGIVEDEYLVVRFTRDGKLIPLRGSHNESRGRELAANLSKSRFTTRLYHLTEHDQGFGWVNIAEYYDGRVLEGRGQPGVKPNAKCRIERVKSASQSA